MLFYIKQKTAYEMRISDWSSYVCSSDLVALGAGAISGRAGQPALGLGDGGAGQLADIETVLRRLELARQHVPVGEVQLEHPHVAPDAGIVRDSAQQTVLLRRSQARGLRQHLLLRQQGSRTGRAPAVHAT